MSSEMNKRFLKYLRIVTAAHVGLLVILLTTSGWSGLFSRPPDLVTPVDFLIEVPGDPIPNKKVSIVEPEPEQPKGEDESSIDSIKIDGKKSRKTIERSTKKITRIAGGGGGGAKKTSLTPEQIKKFLDMGAKASDHTSIPGDEETRCFAIVRQTMYDAWNQPSKEEAANAEADVMIGLSRDGTVLSRKMSRKSGNSVFDESVMQAVSLVQNVEHLTPSFLDKYRDIRITFKLE